MTVLYDTRVGEVRPSQLMWSYGVGALIDLPHLCVLVAGLDDWVIDNNARLITEPRVLRAVQKALGERVQRLLAPPLPPADLMRIDPFSSEAKIGVPVIGFPSWMRCPACQLLTTLSSELLDFKPHPTRPDRTKYVHRNCDASKGNSPAVVPARFLVACESGHLDDFPWREFVHRGNTACTGALRMRQVGASFEAVNLFVSCDNQHGKFDDDGNTTFAGCGMQSRSMVEAVSQVQSLAALPVCRGRHPHLRESEDCGRPLKTILLGSTSGWFAKTITALSIPTSDDELDAFIEEDWANLQFLEDLRDIGKDRKRNRLGPLAKFTDEQIHKAVETRRKIESEVEPEEDMKPAEWKVFTTRPFAMGKRDFELAEGEVPNGFTDLLEPTVLVKKIREVNALVGFTRLTSPEEIDSEGEAPKWVRLARTNRPDPVDFVPASEVRGEGLFIQFRADRIDQWAESVEATALDRELSQANANWRSARNLAPRQETYPGARYVALHTFSHLLMRELVLECGYSAASVRERIYSSRPGDPTPMAGVLIYTAAPDSEGTLGGLVALGQGEMLGRMIDQALKRSELCASDPLCAEHTPSNDGSLHGAACHTCVFVPETSCESGNRFVDRASLVSTLTHLDTGLFVG